MQATSVRSTPGKSSNSLLTTALFTRSGLIVLLITLLASVLRIAYLDSQGLTLDESLSVLICRQSTPNFLHTLWHSEFNMVLYYVLLRAFIHVGYSEWTVRLPGVLFSVATVPVVFLLGERLFNRRTGFLASLLLALHPYHLMLAQRARSYPLLILLVALASLCFLWALQKSTFAHWAAFAALSAAAVYSHFFGVLVVFALLLTLIFRKDSVPWANVLLSTVLLCILLVPLCVYLLTNGSMAHVDWIQDLSLRQFLTLFYSLTLGKARAAAYLLLWSVAAFAAWRTKDTSKRWSFQFTFLWLLLPIMLAATISLHRPLIVERYLSICIPASVLLAAAGADRLADMSRLSALVIVVFILFWSGSAVRSYMRHPEFAEGWRENSNWILQRAQRNDVVIAEGAAGIVFDYYRDRFGPSAPNLVRLDDLHGGLPSSPPSDVWILGSVRFNPNWRGAIPGETEKAVARFAEVHHGEYCLVLPNHDAGETRVWNFTPCSRTSSGAATVP